MDCQQKQERGEVVTKLYLTAAADTDRHQEAEEGVLKTQLIQNREVEQVSQNGVTDLVYIT